MHDVKWMVGVAMVGYLPYAAILVVLVLAALLMWPMLFDAGYQRGVFNLLQLFGILLVLMVYVGVGGTAHYLYLSRVRL
jgi:hypothetical protein